MMTRHTTLIQSVNDKHAGLPLFSMQEWKPAKGNKNFLVSAAEEPITINHLAVLKWGRRGEEEEAEGSVKAT
ncbi:hypothetical protein E2C01_029485 [Portunus trituberculatus]|uniref:Uncharacterized protein n=1 Tax=Portunus trituberculatus TaxID=210409 RepID=A0A5B7ENJ7_PORTR|nr:hypothetical protein [Portunus trituberculatus]